ncbi:MAG: hypothetical protein QME94_14025 [Anaerolineae bacterium]|nr:hypothetical protein [Anaerolineae bacterium]
MPSDRPPTAVAALLIGLPLLAKVMSFLVCARLFACASAAAPAVYQHAGRRPGLAVVAIEAIGVALVAGRYSGA